MTFKQLSSIPRVALAVACMALIGTAAQAQPTWSEKTIIKFDSPVMIPGATLQPGSYVFELADSKSNRNVMQIYTQDDRQLVATTMTVPARRMEPNGDVVLKFARTDGPEPVALKGFFYPGSLYGHEFVYSDDEARDIADKSNTLVLSKDVQGTDLESGTLRSLDRQGTATSWNPDPDVARDWNVWIAEWRTVAPAATADQPADAAVGTTGTTGRTASGMNAAGAESAASHAAAIQRLVDQALTKSGSSLSVDRSTLQQIREHADAIAKANGQTGSTSKK